MSKRLHRELAHPAYAELPIQLVTTGTGGERMAVHISGRLHSARPPLICVPGYHRNMTDFTDLVRPFARIMGEDWPLVLIDCHGRGRSTDRPNAAGYTSLNDARDIAAVTDALGIGKAVLLGQGYGGQVVMTVAQQRPSLIAAAILVDAGPVTDSRGLVRLRNNLEHIAELRGEGLIRAALRRVLAADYPGASESQLDRLARRTHMIDKRGRALPLFDPFFLKRLHDFEYDDVLLAQWPMFEALAAIPLMILRTQLTDQLRRQTFDEMVRRRPDAVALTIADQGSPALLDHDDEVDAICTFIRSALVAVEQPGPPVLA